MACTLSLRTPRRLPSLTGRECRSYITAENLLISIGQTSGRRPPYAWSRDTIATEILTFLANGSACQFVTRKTTLLLSSFLGVVTSTVPVVAPVGTVVVIAVPDLLTVKVG